MQCTVLVQLLTELILQYSTFCYQIGETNFSFFHKISMNATVEFGNICFFKDMHFYGHEFFRTVSDSCFKVTFISDSENHKWHDNFCSIFSMSVKFSLWLWGIPFWNFQEITIKKPRDGFFILLRRRSQDLRHFLRNFQKFPEQIISRTIVKDCFGAF